MKFFGCRAFLLLARRGEARRRRGILKIEILSFHPEQKIAEGEKKLPEKGGGSRYIPERIPIGAPR